MGHGSRSFASGVTRIVGLDDVTKGGGFRLSDNGSSNVGVAVMQISDGQAQKPARLRRVTGRHGRLERLGAEE